MSKLITTFTVAFFMFTLLSGIVEGGSGNISTSRLYTNIDEVATTIRVQDTTGFLGASYVTIGEEQIRYTSITTANPYQFTGCTRGWNNTEAVAHVASAAVFSPEANVINAALGFNVASVGTTIGTIDLALFLPRFASTTLPRLISWDFNYLKTGYMQYFRYFLFCISAGFLLTIIIAIVSALGGVLQSIFIR